jgi:hypothetical protein
MNILIFLVTYLFLPVTPIAENKNLNEFSYHLIAINWVKGIVNNSTGFFIRRENRLFFVTASHALTGWNAMQLTNDTDYPDEASIILRRKADNQIEPLGINLKPFKTNHKEITVGTDADIGIIEFSDDVQKKYKINSIEGYLGEGAFDNKLDLSVSGFINTYPPGTHLRNVIKDDSKTGILKHFTGNATNEINYEAQTVSGVVTPGFSGAPVFAISPKGTKFNGVCIGGDPGTPQFPKLIIVKPNILFDAIKTLLAKKSSPISKSKSYLIEWIKLNGLN